MLAGLLGAAAAAELGFRALAGAEAAERVRLRRELVCGGSVGRFEARPHTLFRRAAGLEGINAEGFFGDDWPVERTTGVPRILCLGASTTEGGNGVGGEGSFPTMLEGVIEQRIGQEVEVLNAGLSGWTTAESLAFWFLCGKDYRPDYVVLHHAVNDAGPRLAPGFRSDYAHYRRPWSAPRFSWIETKLTAVSDLAAWLGARDGQPTLDDVVVRPFGGEGTLQGGRLPEGTADAFRRNVVSIAEDVQRGGGRVVLATMPFDPRSDGDAAEERGWRAGILEHNGILRGLCAERGYLLADMARWVEANAAGSEGLFLDLVHMNPAGNMGKALLLADVILESWARDTR